MLTKRERQIIENEDPRVLRALMASMAEHIKMQQELIDKLQTEKAVKDQAAFVMEEKVKLLRRELFGKSSEVREASDRPRDKSQEAALLFSQAAFPSLEIRADEKNQSKGKNLPERIIEHHASDEELMEESAVRGIEKPSAQQWAKTGFYDECTKIQIIERSYVREVHRRYKYKLKSIFNQSDKEVIVTAKGKAELLPGMSYTTEFVGSVVADKFISHVPLERQTREMESLGLCGIKNSTLSRFAALAGATLEPLQERILKEDILTSPLALHVDETPWNIQNKHEKDGYMWVISNSHGSYYFFEPTRSAKVIKSKLKNYRGPVMTDGYRSYDSVLEELDVPRAYCWAHARREFINLESHDPSVKPILDFIDSLFTIEREAKTFEELKILRDEKSREVIANLFNILTQEKINSREQSQKRKAIDYTLTRWQGLTIFLSDTRIPLSNNEAERTIRHSVIGRKNFYGSGSYTGADSAATLYTVIESCKKNDIDPRTFLLMSLERAANSKELETPLAYAKRTRPSQNAN